MVKIIDPKLCLKCKGRLWCGLKKCPIYEKIKLTKGFSMGFFEKRAEETPPFVLVSWKDYGKRLLLGKEEKSSLDAYFASRASSVITKGNFPLDVALSVKETFVEAEKFKVKKAPAFAPFGFFGRAERILPSDTPKVPAVVYNLIDSTDIKAETAVELLYRKYGVEYAARALSLGVLGLKFQRKEVPTRWAITAVDSTISRKFIEELKDCRTLDAYYLFHGRRWGNVYTVAMFPQPWAFELLELWLPGAAWGHGVISDFEYLKPKTGPAETAGSYYAARLAVAEKLKAMRRKAAVVIFREVTPDYYFPAGVWNVREGVRETLKQKPEVFDSLEELLKAVKEKLNRKDLLDKSRVIKIIKGQKTLEVFSRSTG